MGDPIFSERGWHPIVPMGGPEGVLMHLHSIFQNHGVATSIVLVRC